MISSFLFLSFLAGQTPAPSGKPDEPKARYDVQPLVRLYQQSTPKQALESAIKAAEKGRFDYVAAQLLDPTFVESESTNRGVVFTVDVETSLRSLRMKQKEGTASGTPIPDEPEKLKPLIDAECQARGFYRLVNDLKELATDDPSQLKELRRFFRDGKVEENGDTAKITLADTKDRAVFLKKVNGRWFVENRQYDEKPAAKPVEGNP